MPLFYTLFNVLVLLDVFMMLPGGADDKHPNTQGSAIHDKKRLLQSTLRLTLDSRRRGGSRTPPPPPSPMLYGHQFANDVKRGEERDSIFLDPWWLLGPGHEVTSNRRLWDLGAELVDSIPNSIKVNFLVGSDDRLEINRSWEAFVTVPKSQSSRFLSITVPPTPSK